MKKGKTNFAYALDYLRANGFIHSQKDLADRIGSTATTISRNKHGLVGRTDEETVAKFHAVFGHIINTAYLRGESDKMLIADLSPKEKRNIGVNFENAAKSTTDAPTTSSLINAAIAAKDETIESLKRELSAKDDLIAALREQITDRNQLMQTIQQQADDLTKKYSDLLQAHNTLLHRINVNIEHFQDSQLSIAAESMGGYGKQSNEK